MKLKTKIGTITIKKSLTKILIEDENKDGTFYFSFLKKHLEAIWIPHRVDAQIVLQVKGFQHGYMLESLEDAYKLFNYLR